MPRAKEIDQKKLMQTIDTLNNGTVPTQGALLCLPASRDAGRRVWMTQRPFQRAALPQPGQFSIYAPDFFLDTSTPWLLPEDPAGPGWIGEFTAHDLSRRIAARPDESLPRRSLCWLPPRRDFFEECFGDLQAHFQSGRLTKAVPVFFEQAASATDPSQIAHLLAALLRAPETLMPYGYWSAQGGLLGASPELLFEVQGGVLKTMALAGTLAAPQTADASLLDAAGQAFLSDSKERREHKLVIEGIADSLAPLGAVQIGETDILKLPTLWHLRTPIEVVLRETPEFETLVRRLHPTPALGGSPRQASLDWLRRQDSGQAGDGRREGYGAPFGAQCADGSAFCLVAVRNLMWTADTLRIGAGCGMIRESVMEREWEELFQKRESVKKLLGL